MTSRGAAISNTVLVCSVSATPWISLRQLLGMMHKCLFCTTLLKWVKIFKISKSSYTDCAVPGNWCRPQGFHWNCQCSISCEGLGYGQCWLTRHEHRLLGSSFQLLLAYYMNKQACSVVYCIHDVWNCTVCILPLPCASFSHPEHQLSMHCVSPSCQKI